jgi:hypothetical protein
MFDTKPAAQVLGCAFVSVGLLLTSGLLTLGMWMGKTGFGWTWALMPAFFWLSFVLTGLIVGVMDGISKRRKKP